jgi:hypothetical protein
MKQASVMVKLVVFLIVIVITSSIVLLLVRTGVVDQTNSNENVLNIDFIPITTGDLNIRSVILCGSLEEFECLESEEFSVGEKVNVLFLVETDVDAGRVLLVRSYKVTNANGEVVFASSGKNNVVFEETSEKSAELVGFSDSFTPSGSGEFTLDAIIENPILGKKVTASKRFVIG